VVTLQGSNVGGGVVLQTTNPAAARSRLDQLGSLLTFAGVSGASTETYRDSKLLKLPLAGIVALAGGAVPGGLPGGGVSPLPPDIGNQVLVLGVHESLVVASLGDTFAKSVIDTVAGSSLADQSGYRAAIELAGSPNFGQAYVDVPDLITAITTSLAPDQVAAFDRDLRPYLQPIAAVAMSATSRDGLIRSRVVVNIP
jgi:hypothetical protein